LVEAALDRLPVLFVLGKAPGEHISNFVRCEVSSAFELDHAFDKQSHSVDVFLGDQIFTYCLIDSKNLFLLHRIIDDQMRDSPVIEKNGKFESFTQKRPHLFAARARCLSKGEVLKWYDRINQ
jgi:hypothetical protein